MNLPELLLKTGTVFLASVWCVINHFYLFLFASPSFYSLQWYLFTQYLHRWFLLATVYFVNIIYYLYSLPTLNKLYIHYIHMLSGYEPPLVIMGKLENLEAVSFPGPELFWNFTGGYPLEESVSPRGVYISYGGPGAFWPISYNINNWLFISLHLYFVKIWLKLLFFPQKISLFFSVNLVFMQLCKSLDW